MSKREEMKALREADRRRQNTITIIIIAVGALLITGALIWPSIKRQVVKPNPRPMADYNSMGNKNAKVKVEEFSDFQCPYCREFALKAEPEFVKQYVETGKVFVTFTPFSFIGEESVKAAEAAYCAADQGKFWEYHDLLFENQNGENKGNFTRSLFLQFAKDLSLDTAAFQTCIDNGTNAAKVKDNMTYGQNKGVNGTPYFMVNGTLVDSSKLIETVEKALKEQ
ncbi:DsbA family protein [Leptolinea tardivitalis]|uniref:DsbA family protein n=1 Tax=Leptolinea tardivitalis TaxID=229920 RepID=UPI00078021D7|nr:thioredoxin domain-containing protein [Leptolinea tardivitalis]GAP20128.1 protein-disulfide isomerase [Leptolinea tardivitalis]